MIKPFTSLFVAVVCLSACAVKLPHSANEIPLTYISSLDQNSSFSAAPAGDVIAYSHRGIKLLDAESGNEEMLATTKSDIFVWSADGQQIAFATPEGDASSRITIFSEEGRFLADYEVPVVLNGLKWTAQGDLLATGFLLKVYSFGSNLRQSLYRISEGKVSNFTLTDTTLKPVTSKALAPVLGDLLPVRFSSYGDDLVYVSLHDPPEFPPYLAVMFRNWQSGKSRVLQKFPLQRLKIRVGHDEDAVEVLSRDGTTSLRLWPKREEGRDEEPPYRFVDGELIQGNVELADWGQNSHLQLLNNGTYLLGVNNRLFLGKGLRSAKVDIYNEKKWSLRRWRHEGLISNDEYHELLKGLKP